MNSFISYSAVLRFRIAVIILSGFFLFILPSSAAAQDIGWSPTSMFFDSTVIGTKATQTLTLTNLDAALTMSVNSIVWTYNEPGEVTGTDSYQFVADRVVPATLAPGESMDINISFTPEGWSFKSANLLITNSSNNASSLNYWVMGDGVEGEKIIIAPIIMYLLD